MSLKNKDDKAKGLAGKKKGVLQSEIDSTPLVVPSVSNSLAKASNSVFLPVGLDCGGEKRSKKAKKKQKETQKSKKVTIQTKDNNDVLAVVFMDHNYSKSTLIKVLLVFFITILDLLLISIWLIFTVRHQHIAK